ncbi:NUDIX hydrolase [Plantactinospora soyae]|uniref:8-oxo-dGTP pyrophosphatase MutT (NUDIX family) n=1 Tax=Plantactinospora soyae TaxID=1544732 RepID=A0A927QZJ5_9ACTN|nr:NUDIX hydrolase [Plantactinospora soyae]MBE1489122.1 8-oxo-dGTP pyrophosphatase MutT (NUDIX family) [Plantactinospora soyae]
MEIVDQWTGLHACALQSALRLTQGEFAGQLGVARRTVASWHERPDIVLRTELQRVLDTAYERAGEPTKLRFVRQIRASEAADARSGEAVELTVAIAVVATESDVLIVCRRDEDPSGITWQFPAGIVKPGASASTIAVRETLAETGIHCVVRERLGSRIHPLSGVNCEYFWCEYLTGSVENRDVSENMDALWVKWRDLTRFIPSDRIYPPVLRALREEL